MPRQPSFLVSLFRGLWILAMVLFLATPSRADDKDIINKMRSAWDRLPWLKPGDFSKFCARVIGG